MSGPRLALEQFAAKRPARPSAADRDAGDGALAALDLPNEPDPDFEPDVNSGGLAPMDGPPVRRAAAALPDPAAEEAEALRAELEQACARLNGVIAAIEAERRDALATVIAETADDIAAVGADLLTSLVDRGLAAEIAAAVVDLAGRIPHAAARLHVAAEDHETLASCIAAHAPRTEIALVSDPDLASGQARMTWPEGGADFDVADITARIAPLIAERLNNRKPRSA